MNDFPDLLPPPPRDLTPEQRDRLRAQLPLEHGTGTERPWWVVGGAAAAAVLLVVGAAVGLGHMVGKGSTPRHQVGPAAPHAHTDPLPNDANGTMCFERAPRTDTLFEQVTPIRSVVATGYGFESVRGATIDRASVAAQPAGQTSSEGDFQDPIPASIVRETGWKHRRPLVGAHLVKGTTYTIFFRITLAAHAQFVGPVIRYTDDDGSHGVSVWKQTVSARTKCS